jgi:hypothetical protein
MRLFVEDSLMTEPTRPTFMAITSTGGYIGRWYWNNSGIHPDFPYWGSVQAMPDSKLPGCPWGVWAGLFPVIRQIINWRFYEPD